MSARPISATVDEEAMSARDASRGRMDMISILRRSGSMFFLLSVFAATDAMGQPEPIDLGTLGGTSSTPTAINEAGQVVGDSTIASGDTHAFVWTPTSGMMDLGTLLSRQSTSCAPQPQCRTSVAQAINNLGHVAVTGPADRSVVLSAWFVGAYLWTPDGGMVSLDQNVGGSVVSAVNDVGQLVGSADVFSHSDGVPMERQSWCAAAGSAGPWFSQLGRGREQPRTCGWL